ncbi:MAG: DUF465 domain-containing protein [Candidatus Saccharicenans sp.]|jgi:uncharacterized protein YdcH (DUF465 family)|nr:DUF465 domain-containing protein [Candidatus Saccharicenans sp.]MDH7492304.1 DUF465 domain-containing protein [Candidatus Saccharicenans sp.]
MTEEKIKELLLKDNETFRKIYQDHQECEQALSRLRAKSFLTEEDRLQEKLLKKKKLRLKDEMYRMILEFQQRTGHE